MSWVGLVLVLESYWAEFVLVLMFRVSARELLGGVRDSVDVSC